MFAIGIRGFWHLVSSAIDLLCQTLPALCFHFYYHKSWVVNLLLNILWIFKYFETVKFADNHGVMVICSVTLKWKYFNYFFFLYKEFHFFTGKLIYIGVNVSCALKENINLVLKVSLNSQLLCLLWWSDRLSHPWSATKSLCWCNSAAHRAKLESWSSSTVISVLIALGIFHWSFFTGINNCQ